MMHNRIANMLAIAGMAMSAFGFSKAFDRVGDRWNFDIPAGTDPMEAKFTTPYHPVRVAELHPGVIVGVAGVEGQALWCAPGASIRLPSAVILPARGDFTFSFYAGFVPPFTGGQQLARNPKMSVFLTAEGRFAATLARTTVSGGASVADGRWHHLAVVRRGDELSLWVDGEKVAAKAQVKDTVYDHIEGAAAQWMLLSTENRNRMFLDEVTAHTAALAPEDLRQFAARAAAAKVPQMTPEQEAAETARRRALDPPLASEEEYTPLTIGKGELRTFAEQHDVFALAVPWFDPAGRDLICEGSIFGSRPLLYRFLRLENGVPVYAEGIPYTDISPRGASPWYGKDGAFGICRVETRLLDGGRKKVGELVRYRFDRASHRFGSAEVVLGTDGKPYRLPGGRVMFADLDGDGVDDLLSTHLNVGRGGTSGCNDGFPWPKNGNSPWTDEETPYSGIGRGYDVFGNWMGTENIAEVHWAKGTVASDGSLRFGASRPVYVDMPDLPNVKRVLTWKMYMSIMGSAVIDAPSGRHLVLFGAMNQIASFPIRRVTDGDVYCGLPQPLLACGYTTPHNYWILHIQALDFDGDGRKELLLDGNPGTVGILKGVEPGSWTSARALIQGGAICGETLSAPTRYDWDHDGKADIILTDASGWMTFWGGTDDPLVYKGARSFTVGGKPFCLKGGDSGSLQGKVERVWGYVKVIAGTWGGSDAIITSDIRGDLLLHRRASGGDPLALAPAEPFRHPDGRPFKVAWRSRPDFVPAGFAGVPRQSLLFMDADGDAALAIPEAEGSLVLAEVRKLSFADGSHIRLCGKNGLWGRGHLELVDWDGDGKEDIIFGTNQSCQKYFCKKRIRTNATPFLYRNVGSREKPRFAEPVPFCLKKSGNRLAFGCHNATPWVTDLDGDGRPDLLVSAENGKVYAFRHDEIFAGNP